MKNRELETAGEFIQSVRNVVQPKLDRESIDAINHYLEHEEYEMAFEGLFIEIMKLKEKPKIDYQKALQIGKSLSLDKESVFEIDFWHKLTHYIDNSAMHSID